MSRPLRIEFPGAYYHVMQRGLEKRFIYRLDQEKEKLLTYIKEARHMYKMRVHAYVIMDNHYHFIIETLDANLSKVMHYINASYAMYYNRKRKRIGPLHQGRYKAVLVQANEYLHQLTRYIHLNPVRAGKVRRAQDYEWSSCRYYYNEKESEWIETSFILNIISDQKEKARYSYKKFIESAESSEVEDLKKQIKKGVILGREEYYDYIFEKYIKGKKDEEIPALRELKVCPGLKYIEAEVKKKVGLDAILGRKIGVYLSRKYSQKKLKEIGKYYGGLGDTGVGQMCLRIKKARNKDRQLDKLILEIEKKVKAWSVET